MQRQRNIVWKVLSVRCHRYIHYGYVGRVAMFSLHELLYGASIAQVYHDLHFDPPEDKAAIQTGWAAFDKGLCGAIQEFDSQLAKNASCNKCPLQGNP
jgi:hypothetical protein